MSENGFKIPVNGKDDTDNAQQFDNDRDELETEVRASEHDANDAESDGTLQEEAPPHVDKSVDNPVDNPVDKEEIDWKDRYLRSQAAFENATRTIPKRVEEGISRFKRSHFSHLLELCDGFDRALAHAGEADDQWRQGIESLRRILCDVLAKAGVKRMATKGAAFDAAWHEVISTVPATDRADGEILEEARSGWTMDGKLLRAAQVVVVAHPSE